MAADLSRVFAAVSTRAIALGLLSSVSLSAAGPALPASPPPTASAPMDDAKKVYEEAARAYEQHRYVEAIELFSKANELRPNPAFDFNIGLAYEDMGDGARALSHYRSYLRRAPDAADRSEVEERIVRLEKKLASKDLQQVTIFSQPGGARVEIDGQAIGVTPWTGEIAPGFHRLTLELRGYEREERTFDLPEGRAIDVPVTLSKKAQPKPPAPPPIEKPREAACDGVCFEAVETSSWVVVSVGAASLAAAVAFEVHRAGREDSANREQNQLEASRLYDDALASQRWATGFGMMGGALLLTGVVLGTIDITAANRPSEQEVAASGLSLGCAPLGCAMEWQQRF